MSDGSYTASLFPRDPDNQPEAYPGGDGRFSDSYEARAQTLAQAVEMAGYAPALDWAGSEDGEALLALDKTSGELMWVVHLEDPHEQALVDQHIASNTLYTFVQDAIANPHAH